MLAVTIVTMELVTVSRVRKASAATATVPSTLTNFGTARQILLAGASQLQLPKERPMVSRLLGLMPNADVRRPNFLE